jgi:hypothetical protein
MTNLDPEQVLNLFAKNVDVSGYAGPIPNSLLARQDLEAEIVKLTNRNTPLRDMLKRVRGEGRAHLWNQRKALGALPNNNSQLEVFYKDGGLPTQSDPVYVQKTAAYVYLGVTGVITGPMIASGRSFADIEAEVAESKLREVVQAEEWCNFNGDSTVANSQGATGYDGLSKQISTNTIDKLGASLTGVGNSVKELDRIIKLVRLQGGMPTHFFCSFGMQSVINQIVAPQARFLVENGTTITAGVNAFNYQSPAGILPIVGDFFINPATPYSYNTAGSSGPEGQATSDIFLLQVPEIEMADLMPVGRTELAKVADTIRFYISCYTILAVKAEPWCGIVKNVNDPQS